RVATRDRRSDRPPPERGMDGHRATVHAADPGDPATEVEPRAHPPGGGAEPGDQQRRRRHHDAACPRGRARLGPGRPSQRHRAAGARLRTADAADASSRRARLRLPACGAAQARRHARAPPPRIPRAASRRVPPHPVLRDLSPLAQAARAVDASSPSGGEKLFVDYAGHKPSLIDPATGERISAELFVAVLGASNYTYAEATLTQQVPDWIASHQRAFAFLGGVTTALVCDQLKSGVVIPCRYEPGLQHTYDEFAQHYGT